MSDPTDGETFASFLGLEPDAPAAEPTPSTGPRPDYTQGGTGEPPPRGPAEMFADFVSDAGSTWQHLI